jgi:hypothetical protein
VAAGASAIRREMAASGITLVRFCSRDLTTDGGAGLTATRNCYTLRHCCAHITSTHTTAPTERDNTTATMKLVRYVEAPRTRAQKPDAERSLQGCAHERLADLET